MALAVSLTTGRPMAWQLLLTGDRGTDPLVGGVLVGCVMSLVVIGFPFINMRARLKEKKK